MARSSSSPSNFRGRITKNSREKWRKQWWMGEPCESFPYRTWKYAQYIDSMDILGQIRQRPSYLEVTSSPKAIGGAAGSTTGLHGENLPSIRRRGKPPWCTPFMDPSWPNCFGERRCRVLSLEFRSDLMTIYTKMCKYIYCIYIYIIPVPVSSRIP